MSSFWREREVVVVAGTGGVGKTTASAALALAAASEGLRTLVMTIDPSRRLAHALGIEERGNVERRMSEDQLTALGVTLKAPLWVMVPDVKRTFDDIVERAAPSVAWRQQIFANRIYQHFSSALAGSHEYAAIEKLHEMHASGRFDLIVLDTPPSQQAVDFLDAPNRVLDFLENETLQWLVKPKALSTKMLDGTRALFWRTLGSIAGGDTLRELADFILSFRSMYEGFRARARLVRTLLASDALTFALVTTTAPAQRHAMLRFESDLSARKLGVGALIVNRVRSRPSWTEPAVRRAHAVLASIDPEAAKEVEQAAIDELQAAESDARAIDELEREHVRTPVVVLKERPTDVHDLEGLSALYRAFL